jgi:hypothetical protein
MLTQNENMWLHKNDTTDIKVDAVKKGKSDPQYVVYFVKMGVLYKKNMAEQESKN